jgi:hypothetical protein
LLLETLVALSTEKAMRFRNARSGRRSPLTVGIHPRGDFGGRRVPGVLRTARVRNAVPADADDQPIIRN